MTDILFYLVPSIITYTFYYGLVVKRTGIFSIDNIFIISQFTMLLGSLSLLDLTNYVDVQYAIILAYTLPIFIISAFVGEFIFNRWRTIRILETTMYIPNKSFYYLLVFSMIVTILYYQSVGYNVFFLGISSLFSGATNDIASLRLNSYSGSRYLFPGYVNQFKNTILPSFSLILVLYLYFMNNKYRFALSAGLISISLIGVLGTGQRGAFVLFIIVVMGFIYFYNRKVFVKSIRAVILFGIPIFFLSSIVLDRNDTQSAFSTDPVQAVSILTTELSNRFFRENQLTGVVGFRYVAFLPTQEGAEWAQAALGLLPGENFRGSDLSGRIFEAIYGSDRGTAPIGIWGSVYYNFGFIGTILLPLILGLLYKAIYSFFSKKSSMNHGQILGMSGVFMTLGLWISDGPITVINTGIFAYVLIYIICSKGYNYTIVREN